MPDHDPTPDLDIAVVRLDPDLPLPSYAHPGDAGADLHTTVDVHLAPGERALVPTGIGIALPDGYVALVHPRSGLAARHGLSMLKDEGLTVTRHGSGVFVRSFEPIVRDSTGGTAGEIPSR